MIISLPYLLLLIPGSIAILLLLQFFRSRRQEVLVGSLLIWHRVAASIHSPTPKRILLDRTFWLQAAAICCLAAALAGISITYTGQPGRRVVLLLDNGPAARMKNTQGHLIWNASRDAAHQLLTDLEADDRVALVISGPRPTRLDDGHGFSPTEAKQKLKNLTPAVSFVSVEDAWRFAKEVSRNFAPNTEQSLAPLIAFSPRALPATIREQTNAHWFQRNALESAENISLSVFGSAQLLEQQGAEVLVQVRNHGATQQKGKLRLEFLQTSTPGDADKRPPLERTLTLSAGEMSAITFSVPTPSNPIQISWLGAAADAFLEDDTIIALPRTTARPRIRFHGSAPHLRTLLTKACRARILKPGTEESSDLEIFVNEVPARLPSPASTSTVVFFAPTQSFDIFEVQAETLKAPIPHLASPDELTRDMQPQAAGLGFPIAQCRKLSAMGDWKVILRDQDDHPLFTRFRFKDGRQAFLFGFIPGEGLGWKPDHKFRNDVLVTILIRLLKEATGAGTPYHIKPLSQLERTTGTSYPMGHLKNRETKDSISFGVLDPRASTPALKVGPEKQVTLNSLLPTPQVQGIPLWPWLVLAAMILTVIEVLLDRPSVRKQTKSMALTHV